MRQGLRPATDRDGRRACSAPRRDSSPSQTRSAVDRRRADVQPLGRLANREESLQTREAPAASDRSLRELPAKGELLVPDGLVGPDVAEPARYGGERIRTSEG